MIIPDCYFTRTTFVTELLPVFFCWEMSTLSSVRLLPFFSPPHFHSSLKRSRLFRANYNHCPTQEWPMASNAWNLSTQTPEYLRLSGQFFPICFRILLPTRRLPNFFPPPTPPVSAGTFGSTNPVTGVEVLRAVWWGNLMIVTGNWTKAVSRGGASRTVGRSPTPQENFRSEFGAGWWTRKRATT